MTFIWSILAPFALTGQTVSAINIEGNRVTQNHIILREISQAIGEPYDSLAAESDRNRIYNLGIFDAVDIYPEPLPDGSVRLTAVVRETIRMLPVPIAYQVDDLGWSYGGGISFINFRGLNQRLDLSATTGVEKTYNILFFDPWKWGQRVSVKVWAAQRYQGHPVWDYRVKTSRFEFGLGKFSTQKIDAGRLAVIVEELEIEWRPDSRGLDPPDGLRSTVRHSFARFRMDLHRRTMDIWRDPENGYRLYIQVTPIRSLNGHSPDYNYLRMDGAIYRRVRGGTRPTILASGLSYSAYTGDVPFYRLQFLGGSWVRGHPVSPIDAAEIVRDRMMAEQLLVGSIELRQTLLPRRFKGLAELGLSGVLFLDAGWAFGPVVTLGDAKPLVGFGAGLRLFLPYLDNLGLDVGLNGVGTPVTFRLRLGHKF